MLVCRTAMDNLTHTVIGGIAGQALASVWPSGARHRGLLPAIGMIGGNLPDLDLLYSYRGRGTDLGQLTYLLEHRGYTHTLLGCLALAALLYGGAALLARRRGGNLDARTHGGLFAWAVGATLLHLAMDALNSYGVHPFWPIDNRWVYGDSVFIVEPLYWVAAAPLLFVLRSRVARALVGLVLVAGVALSAASGLVPAACVVLLSVLALGLLAAGRALRGERAAGLSAAAVVLITALLVAGGQVARAQARQAAARDFAGETLVDLVLSPMPADPLCWDALVLAVERDQYYAHRATVALAPGLIAAADCRDRDLHRQTTARWRAAVVPSPGSGLAWQDYTLSLPALRALVRQHCQAGALMQFVRAPFLAQEDADTVLGDLRFDREAGPGLAKLRFPRPGPETCPRPAPWLAPRAALLAP